VQQALLGAGLTGNEDVRICLANEACPSGTVGCACRGVVDGQCDPPYQCQDGTCRPCQDKGCSCTQDSDCGTSLVCSGGTCCDPATGCSCFSQRDCEHAYPGQEVNCLNSFCERAGMCQVNDTLGKDCSSDGDCCSPVHCFGGVCCSPMGSSPMPCVCKSDSDCNAYYPSGYTCSPSGVCLAPMMCVAPNGGPCCTSSMDCGGAPNVCINGGCCNVADGSCHCSSPADCMPAEGNAGLTCGANGSCQPVAGCDAATGRGVGCLCSDTSQCASGACCGLTGALTHCADPTSPECALPATGGGLP
jgi:hypothetical protein